MDKNILAKYIEEFKEREIYLVERELTVSESKDFIITIIGPRRTGKTYFCYQQMQNKKDFLYANFEDPEFSDFNAVEIKNMIYDYKEIYGKFPSWIFFDEIQNIENWEKALISLYEMKKFFIIITGSSSKLLSKEIATALRGRTITYAILPFSFREYLKAQDIKYQKVMSYSKESEIKHYLRNYLEGSMPQLVFNKEPEFKRRFVIEYIDLVIYRDIIERYNVKNYFILKLMIKQIIGSFAKEFSMHKFYNNLKSQGVKVSKKTTYNYLSYIEDSLSVFLLRKFSYSLKNSELSIPKVYICDNSLAHGGDKSIGRKMENVIFIELLRRKDKSGMEVYYYKTSDGKEVDFVLKNDSGVEQLIQVCYDISDFETKERELRAMIKASKELKCDNLQVITWDYEGEEEFKGKIIRFVVLWKWILGYE